MQLSQRAFLFFGFFLTPGSKLGFLWEFDLERPLLSRTDRFFFLLFFSLSEMGKAGETTLKSIRQLSCSNYFYLLTCSNFTLTTLNSGDEFECNTSHRKTIPQRVQLHCGQWILPINVLSSYSLLI